MGGGFALEPNECGAVNRARNQNWDILWFNSLGKEPSPDLAEFFHRDIATLFQMGFFYPFSGIKYPSFEGLHFPPRSFKTPALLDNVAFVDVKALAVEKLLA